MSLRAFLPFGIFICMVGLFAVPLLQGKDPAILPSAMIGKKMPSFTLPAAVGAGQLSAAGMTQDNKPFLVNFFASWCATCRGEQQVLAAFAQKTGVAVYGIDYKDTKKDVAAWLDRHGNPFRATGFDVEGRVAIDFGVYGVPETFLVGGDGIIRYKHVGALTQADMDSVFGPLLEKTK